MLEQDIKKIMISQDEITEAAKKLGAQLTKDMRGKIRFWVGILKDLFFYGRIGEIY